jgi:hypothetical protein
VPNDGLLKDRDGRVDVLLMNKQNMPGSDLPLECILPNVSSPEALNWAEGQEAEERVPSLEA